MPRKPQVRFFESRNAFYTQFRGKQHKLAEGPDDSPDGPNYLGALTAFRQLMELGNVEHAKDQNTVRVVLETYLAHKKERVSPGTFQRKLYLFRPFCDAHGETPVGGLTHFPVYQFIAAMRSPRRIKNRDYAWTEPTAALFLDALTAAFNWAVKTKLITANPLAGIERPSIRSRSRDCVLTPEQHQRVLAACRSQALRNLCVGLENTGARPGELIAAKASDWNDELGAIVYYGDDRRRQDEFRHKTAAHKDRTIYFTGEALAMLKGLVKEHATGTLFPHSRGGKCSSRSVVSGFLALQERTGLPVTAYSYRHTFATRWLMSGRSIEVLAELLGNTPNTLRKHYSHLCSDRPGIRRHLEEFRTEAGTEKQTALA